MKNKVWNLDQMTSWEYCLPKVNECLRYSSIQKCPIASHFDDQCHQKKGEVVIIVKQSDETKKNDTKIKSGKQNK